MPRTYIDCTCSGDAECTYCAIVRDSLEREATRIETEALLERAAIMRLAREMEEWK